MTNLLSSNLSAICEDEMSFSKLFTLPPDSNLTMRDFQDTICGVNINVTKLVSELEKSVPGFKDFLAAVSNIMWLYATWFVLNKGLSTDKKAMIWSWYNQIPHSAEDVEVLFKTKMSFYI